MNKDSTRKTNIHDVKKQIKKKETGLKDGVFVYTGPMSISEFAIKINKNPTEIIKYFFMSGKILNLNSSLNDEQIAELCLSFGYDFERIKKVTASNLLDELEINDDEKDLVTRPPIVTIMGHVDHGKTTLIDFIRKSEITKSEFGGITQHTGAYQIKTSKGQKITFLDTPGHESFTAMRARGANITDIVIIVIAADDGIMPQTKEAIDHALAAKVPIIVFINKIDKCNVNKEKIFAQLSEAGLTPEEWGGDIIVNYGSGLTGKGVDELFESILLQAELLNLRANKKRHAIGVVIESKVDKGQGVVTTIIVQNGILHLRDFIVAGSDYGRIKKIMSTNLIDKLDYVLPSTPAIITGLNYCPEAGAKFIGFDDEKFAKQFANDKKFEDKQRKLRELNITNDKLKDLKIQNVIIKSDVSGTCEAIKYSLEKLKNDTSTIKIIRSSVGEVTKSDILLAKSTNSIIYSFNLRVNLTIKEYAKQENVILFYSTIIYKIIEHAQKILKGMKEPVYIEKKIGEALIIKNIFSSKIGNIAGSKVISGKIKANCKVEIYRDEKLIHTGFLDSLKIHENNVKVVDKGQEFGCHINKFNEIAESDVIFGYEDEEVIEE